MKMAPVARELDARTGFERILVHTGQHYDDAMSRVFVEELEAGEPDFFLDVGSGTHAEQTARVLERIEPVLLETEPDLVLVPGDVNSTLAAALAAVKLGIPVGHVEAGLRSFDRTMPEELNRILTDAISDLLFTHSPEARTNLEHEGAIGAIHEVGNTMIDTLVRLRPRIDELDAPGRHGLEPGGYVVVTLHRPALVDGPLLGEAFAALGELARRAARRLPGASADSRERSTGSGSPRRPVSCCSTRCRTSSSSASSPARRRRSPTRAGSRRRRPTSASRASRCARPPSARSPSSWGRTRCSASIPRRIREVPALLSEPRVSSVPPLWDGHAAERIVDVL